MVTRLFKSLITPILKYGNLLWGPFYSTDQQALEGVQRHATKLITSISHLSYSERHQILNLPSLYCQRLRGDMIFMYVPNSHHNLDTFLLDLFQPALTTCNRGHSFKYFNYKPHCKTRCQYNFFSS